MKTYVGLTCASLALLCGCDFFNSDAKKVEVLRLEQQQAERVATEKRDMSVALKGYIEGKCKLIEEEGKAVDAKLAAVVADGERLEKAVSGLLSGDEQADASYEVRLLRALKDGSVNELALKYLSAGFSVQVEGFVARVREAREKDAAYRAAIKKSEASFEAKLGGTGNWTGDNDAQRQTEIKRLKREIAELELRKSKAMKELKGSRTQEYDRQDRLRDLDRELRYKRAQLDPLQDPSQRNRQEARVLNERQQAHDRARVIRRDELMEIDRRLKPKVTVLDVAKEVEAATLGKLREAIDAQKKPLVARKEKMSKIVLLAKEMMLEVPVCEGDDLRRLKNRADKQLSLEALK